MCCDSWGRKESDTTEQLNRTKHLISIENLGNIARQEENYLSFPHPKMTTLTIVDVATLGSLPMQIITNALSQNPDVS